MTLLPGVTRTALIGSMRRFLWPDREDAATPSALAEQPHNFELWSSFLRRLKESQSKARLPERLIGSPNDATDAEICLVKGEILLYDGRSDDAQRFFRQAPRLAPTRRAAAAMALHAANQDSDCKHLIESADHARDSGYWATAAELYSEALRAYPDHFGYMVQYAHCLREQGRFALAECYYRSALALGASLPDVDEHLVFVATRQGFRATFAPEDNRRSCGGDALDAPPAMADVEIIVFLLLGRKPALAEVVKLLREQTSIRGLIRVISEADSFVWANAHLLLKETVISSWINVHIESVAEMFDRRWVIDLPGGSQAPGAEIALFELNNEINQHWELRDTGEHTGLGHYYYIISKASGQALTATAISEAGAGAQVFQEVLGHRDTQKWGISNFNDTMIFNKFSGLVLDIQGNDFRSGTPIITYPENPEGTVNQRWKITEV